jgi:hypothetical protein
MSFGPASEARLPHRATLSQPNACQSTGDKIAGATTEFVVAPIALYPDELVSQVRPGSNETRPRLAMPFANFASFISAHFQSLPDLNTH